MACGGNSSEQAHTDGIGVELTGLGLLDTWTLGHGRAGKDNSRKKDREDDAAAGDWAADEADCRSC
jgi:hypothetical protein